MKDFFTNPTVVVPAISWMIAQFLKFGVKAMKGDVSFKYFYKSGDMPSVHTALVVSLLVAVAFVEGLGSTFFGIALAFSMIVIYDAQSVRRAVGEQGGMIARLIQLQKDRYNKVTPTGEKVKLVEVLGHTPIEVLAGAAVGLITGVLLMHNYWSEGTVNYLWNYGETEILVAKIVLIAVLVLSTVTYAILKKRNLRKLPSAKNLATKIAYGFWVPSLFGLLVLWFNSVNLAIFGSKLWLIFTVAWMVVIALMFMPHAISNFVDSRDDEAKELRQQKKQKRQKRRKK